jgi:hypothetical protein
MARSGLIVGYPGVQALDLVGPFEVFTGATQYLAAQGRADDVYTVTIASIGGEPVSTGTGLAFVAQPLPDPAHFDSGHISKASAATKAAATAMLSKETVKHGQLAPSMLLLWEQALRAVRSRRRSGRRPAISAR